MELIEEITIKKTNRSRIDETDFGALEFGKYISDHMLVCDYKDGQWQTPMIVPYGDMSISPAALALHYGQTVFEGMKAFKTASGEINIFQDRKTLRTFHKVIGKDVYDARS